MRNLKPGWNTPSKPQTKVNHPHASLLLLLVFALVAAVVAAVSMHDATLTAQAAEETVYVAEELSGIQAFAPDSEPLAMTANITEHYAVTVKCDGQVRTVFTPAVTVAQLLSDLDITLGEYDKTSMELGAWITEDGTQLKVIRAQYSRISENVEIPYETQRVEDPNLALGTEVVTQEGTSGRQINTYQVIQVEGEEPIYQLIRSAVAYAPTPEIITYGTYEPNTIVTASGERLHYSKVITCTATAYTDHSGNKTSTGTTPRVGAIAVDPRVIPYGTRMYIVTSDGSVIYGYATAEDCGGAIKGNRVDLYYNTESECVQFGRRSVEVYILD